MARAGNIDCIAGRIDRDYPETNPASRLVEKSIAPRDPLHENNLCRRSAVRLIAFSDRPHVPEGIEDHGNIVTFSIYLQLIAFGRASGFFACDHGRGIFQIEPYHRTYRSKRFRKERAATARPNVADLNRPHLRPDHAT